MIQKKTLTASAQHRKVINKTKNEVNQSHYEFIRASNNAGTIGP